MFRYKFDNGKGNRGSEEYEVEAIWDSAIYTKKLNSNYLLGLYYLVSKRDYPKEENT